MSEINNPPLFIVDGTSDYMRAWTDITLRDLFAMAALSSASNKPWYATDQEATALSAAAYKYADAMLAARGE